MFLYEQHFHLTCEFAFFVSFARFFDTFICADDFSADRWKLHLKRSQLQYVCFRNMNFYELFYQT